MPESTTALLVLITAIAPAATRAADWPTYQHDIRRSGVTAERLDPAALGEAWRYQAAHPPVPAWYGPARWDAYANVKNLKSMRNYDPVFHVIAAGERLYFGSTVDDSVRCLDAASGRELWRFTTGGPVRVAPMYAGARLYFGSDDGYAYCISADDGELIWKASASGRSDDVLHNGRVISRFPVRSGVLVAGGVAYFAGSLLPWEDSYLAAVDAMTGEIEGDGRYRLKVDGALTFEGPLLASDTQLIAPQGRIAPQLYDRRTGKPLGGMRGGGGCFVLLTPDKQVLHGPGNKNPQIYANDAADRGAKIAAFPEGNAIVVDGDRSFLLTDTQLVAVDRHKRQRLWATPTTHALSLVLAGDVLFAGGVDSVAAFDAATGKPIWSSPVIGRAFGLAVAGGALYVSTDEGAVHCFRPGADGRVEAPTFSDAADAEADRVERIKPIAARDLLGRWVFHREALAGQAFRNLAGGVSATMPKPLPVIRIGTREAIELDGAAALTLADTLPRKELPTRAFTVEAWVRIDAPAEWGGIVSAIHDNGNDESGWLLGYRGKKFCFALATEKNESLTYLTAEQEFTLGAWHHVVGVYDGKVMSLIVDGRAVARSAAQGGDIRYGNAAFYRIGAYRDSNERHPMTGAVHEVAIYQSAHPLDPIAQRYAASAKAFPELNEPATVAAGPAVRFVAPGRAVVRWSTQQPSPTRLVVEHEGQRRVIADARMTTDHEVTLEGLRRNRVYTYHIEFTERGRTQRTADYECEAFFDYTQRLMPDATAALTTDADAKAAQQLIDAAKIDRGVAVVYGASRAGLAVALARATDLRIIVLDDDAAAIDALRDKLIDGGAYGVRLTAHHVADLNTALLVGPFANLIITPPDNPALLAAAKRMAQPGRGRVIALTNAGAIADDFTRPPLDGAGSWTHQYGSPANSAFGGETLGGASTSTDMRAQWIGRPGPRYQSDREHRDSAPLAADGRLFAQGWKRIIALDQYNGTILWSYELPEMIRFNVTRDCANWCVDDQTVYVAIAGEAWRLDAATGALRDRLAVQPGQRDGWAWDWGFIAREGDLLLGSAVKRGTVFSEFWGGDAWWDQRQGAFAVIASSDNLFALDAATGRPAWRYDGGLILNPTITVADGRVCFVEARHPNDLRSEARRINSPTMWQQMYLVALDAKTGRKLWETQVETTPGFSVTTAYGFGRLALVSSSNTGKFEVHGYDIETGEHAWQADVPWENKGQLGGPAGHHGSHLQRPAIVQDRLFLRPAILNIRSGEQIGNVAKPGHGCGTYAATEYALILRSGNLSMWDNQSGKTTGWDRLRPDCWLSSIPAGGMILSPEGGGGCSCGSWMETSLGFLPTRHLDATP